MYDHHSDLQSAAMLQLAAEQLLSNEDASDDEAQRALELNSLAASLIVRSGSVCFGNDLA